VSSEAVIVALRAEIVHAALSFRDVGMFEAERWRAGLRAVSVVVASWPSPALSGPAATSWRLRRRPSPLRRARVLRERFSSGSRTEVRDDDEGSAGGLGFV
jgi:hypothetical protein